MRTSIDPKLLVEAYLIGGAWCAGAGDEVRNPATGDLLGHLPRFGAGEAREAVEAAAAAFPG